jgi:hypothetical protein
MKRNLKLTVIATLVALATGSVARAEQTKQDPTKYDCRVVVGYKYENAGGKLPRVVPIWGCPDKAKMAAGKCEVNWLGQMRCKE